MLATNVQAKQIELCVTLARGAFAPSDQHVMHRRCTWQRTVGAQGDAPSVHRVVRRRSECKVPYGGSRVHALVWEGSVDDRKKLPEGCKLFLLFE